MFSEQQCKLYLAAKTGDWLTTQDLADIAGIAPRTARHHAHRLVALNIFEQAATWPSRYKLSPKADKKYITQIEQAISVLKLAHTTPT